MSKWILKKNLNSNLTKNSIVEETDLLHTSVIKLNKKFNFFKEGKNFKSVDGTVYKFMGSYSDINDVLQEYKEKESPRYFRWKGHPIGNLIPGDLYEESQLTNVDHAHAVDPGLNVFYIECGDQVVSIRGSKAKLEPLLEIVVPKKDNLEKKVVTEKVINEERYVGPPGPRGMPGEIGPLGPVGRDGLPGRDGEVGPVGVTGRGIKNIDQIDRENVLVHMSDGSVHGLVLPAGNIGPMGPVGLTGPEGPQGIPGEAAERGDPGPQGPVGPMGPKGDKGEQGEVGPQGLAGEVAQRGATGEPGERGEKGDKGERGGRGPIGIPGPVGEAGPAGPDGSRGPRGTKGNRGEVGPTGDSPKLRAKYPLVLDNDSNLFTIDKKFFEKLLSGGDINQQLMNKFINAASSGGGGVDILLDSSMFKKNTNGIDFSSSDFSLERRGKNLGVSLNNNVRMYAGTQGYIEELSVTFNTGDFHINTDTAILYMRLDDAWVEV